MKLPKSPQILYFVSGVKPSKEDLIAANKLRAKVSFRNATVVSPEDACEPCDGVAGAVPKNYAEQFPTAEKAIADFDAAFEAASKLIDDSPPPVAKVAPSKVENDEDGKPKNLPGGDGKLPAWGQPPANTPK